MADQPTRWVGVDDTDSSITYTGDWFETKYQFGPLNRYGPPHYGSQHATVTNGSLSFSFRGWQVLVYGTSHQVDNTTDPVWECVVDGVKYDSKPGPQEDGFTNQWTLCDITLKENGQHTFTLSAVTRGTTFYLDLIQYRPSHELKDKLYPTVFMDSIDRGVKYMEGDWKRIENDVVTLTESNNARVRVDFNGTKVTWVGWVVDGYGLFDSEASYSVDGEDPVFFTVMALPRGVQKVWYHIFFETPTLSRGSHVLEVIHRGQSAPLSLDYLIIDDGDIYSPTLVNLPPIRGSDIETGRPTPMPLPDKSKMRIGAIVGGAIGGFALVGIVVIIMLFVLKRRKRPNQLLLMNATGMMANPTTPLHSSPYSPPMLVQSQPQMIFTNTSSSTVPMPVSTIIGDVQALHNAQPTTRKGATLAAPNPYSPQITHPGSPPPPYLS